MVLELCPNGTLNDLIRVRKTLSETEAACILRDLVHAVHYMHDNLIIHGDLKPHNIFLDKHMRIKVGDFGLASKLKHPNGKCRRFCGTPNYVAPEVLARKEVRAYSIQVDIWSMGVILYCMLVGTPPFEAETVKSTYKRIQATDYHFPAHTTVSPQARDLIASMLQSKPEKRYVGVPESPVVINTVSCDAFHSCLFRFLSFAVQRWTRFAATLSSMSVEILLCMFQVVFLLWKKPRRDRQWQRKRGPSRKTRRWSEWPIGTVEMLLERSSPPPQVQLLQRESWTHLNS